MPPDATENTRCERVSPDIARRGKYLVWTVWLIIVGGVCSLKNWSREGATACEVDTADIKAVGAAGFLAFTAAGVPGTVKRSFLCGGGLGCDEAAGSSLDETSIGWLAVPPGSRACFRGFRAG